MIKTLKARFWEKVDKTDDCWVWISSKISSKPNRGYGRIWVNGKPELAHRISWEIANGPIPKGMQVLHRCDNPSCVRPDHLFLGTQRDNMQDSIEKGRWGNVGVPRGKQQKAKTHCPQGHPYSGANLYIYPDGRRACRTCRALWKSDFNEKCYMSKGETDAKS